MTLREYLTGFSFYNGNRELSNMFEVGEFIIFAGGSGIVKGEDNTWFEVAGPIKNDDSWINPQPISKPVSHYLELTVKNVCNYNSLEM